MSTFKSRHNSSSNQKFLQNIQSYSSANRINTADFVNYLEDRLLGILQNSYDLKSVRFLSLLIDQLNGDILIHVSENDMTKAEYDRNEESLKDFGWDDILFGKSWDELFWGIDTDDESYMDKVKKLNQELQNN